MPLFCVREWSDFIPMTGDDRTKLAQVFYKIKKDSVEAGGREFGAAAERERAGSTLP
jgi:hypothetical protein